ncbi:hypothetical protein D3C78_1710670 [compost metagenome]
MRTRIEISSTNPRWCKRGMLKRMTSSRSASGRLASSTRPPWPMPSGTRPPISPVCERTGNAPSTRSTQTASKPLRTSRKMVSFNMPDSRSMAGRYSERRLDWCVPAAAASAKNATLS